MQEEQETELETKEKEREEKKKEIEEKHKTELREVRMSSYNNSSCCIIL